VTSALLVVVIFLAVFTFGNLLLLFAVIRRLRQLQDLVVPPAIVPAVGTVIEPFEAQTLAGASLTQDDFAGGPKLVAVLSTTCPTCRTMAGDLVSLAGSGPAPVALVVGDPEHENTELLDRLGGLERVALVDRGHLALEALGGISAFPTLLVIRDGQVTGSGTRLDKVIPALHDQRRPKVPAH